MSQAAKRQAAPKHGVVKGSKSVGESVVNRRNEDLEDIHELVIDAKEGWGTGIHEYYGFSPYWNR